MKYTYTIFDASPQSSSGTEWPTHTDMTIEADDDDEAIDEVRDVMSTEAAGLRPADGYEVGEAIHAIVWDADGTIVGQPTYELTKDDLGVYTLSATIHEEGNGLPDADSYVPGVDGNLYRVVSVTSAIQTGRSPGAGNWIRAEVELADWSDCDESAEFPATVRLGEVDE